MGDKTKIQWTDATWNPIRGCSRVSEGCRNCYAETVAHRFSGPGQPYEGLIAKGGQWNGQIAVVPQRFRDPLHWRKPRLVFVNSMSDLFHESVPDRIIDEIFAVMALCPQHTFQILTKRPERMREYTSRAPSDLYYSINNAARHITGRDIAVLPTQAHGMVRDNWPLPNVWLGVSVEDQATFRQRVPYLFQTPAAVRWISAEPLLGPVKFRFYDLLYQHCPVCEVEDNLDEPRGTNSHPTNCAQRTTYPGCDRPGIGINWVVVGGESGKNARPMHPDWARSLRDQCVKAGVPFFFKQWGEFAPSPDGGLPDHLPDSAGYYFSPPDPPGKVWRFGKKRAGRTLDGRTWDEYPANSDEEAEDE